jgi:hypothetical protein
MYSFFKDFAGPLATVIAAGAASFITYRFSNAQRRATEMRLVLDLFDRRWDVTQELRSAISDMVQHGIVPGKSYWQYLRASQRAAILFGPDVTDYLETVRQAMIRHEAEKDRARSDDDAVRGPAVDIQADTFTVISDFYKNFDPLIAPYMQIHQKLPN